uniref:FGGY family carbohydrate kinase n=1 Tax=Listeria costaricensis TaxID=2026604 RepID=UPI001F09AAF0
MTSRFQIAIDQSTSGTKVLLFEAEELIDRLDKKHRQYYPQDGWVEHDPEEISRNVRELIAEMLTSHDLKPEQVERLAITNQRETIVAWDKTTGKPLYNAIVWQCDRTKAICEELRAAGHEERVKAITGLKIDSYFSAPKIKWLLENVPAVREAQEEGRLAVGTMDSWLLFTLTPN